MVVGRPLSFREGLFSGPMLVIGRVTKSPACLKDSWKPKKSTRDLFLPVGLKWLELNSSFVALQERNIRNILKLTLDFAYLWFPNLPSLKLTFSHLRMDDWKTFAFPFGFRPIFCGYVSFREGTHIQPSPIFTCARHKYWKAAQSASKLGSFVKPTSSPLVLVGE